MSYKWLQIIAVAYILVTISLQASNSVPLEISLSISAQTRRLQVSWRNAQLLPGDVILITNSKPIYFENRNEGVNSYSDGDTDGDNDDVESSGGGTYNDFIEAHKARKFVGQWLCNNSTTSVIYVINPQESNDWVTTTIPFDYSLSNQITIETKCYGFWASYVDMNKTIVQTNCISAYPKWMNELRSHIENFRIRDLFIPGTHDSGSYRYRFDPALNETLVSKYALTQDEDITGQLMHGIRYLDIRVGYYRTSNDPFWANHGISRQRPLREILEQVIDFVDDTNEIVVFDIQEFPVGFGRSLNIHRNLVKLLKTKLGDRIVDPSLSWQAKLKDIWQRKQNIILCYDYVAIVEQFPTILFPAIEQKWGNVQSLNDLESFLIKISQQSILKFNSRPVAHMAELTPDTWGVLTDRYGGLRFLADQVNRHVSKWYQGELGHSANIVAVDYYRGTTITETAIAWNLKRIVT